jgi:hypothetical protein
VNGAGFVPESIVHWNESPRDTTFVSTTQLTAEIEADDIAKPGTAYVTVTSPDPGGGVSTPVSFRVVTATSLGTFRTSHIGLNDSGPQFIATADFNGDGTFQSPVQYTVGENPQSIAVGDINNDGKPDLVVANMGCQFGGGQCSPTKVSILLGNGDGTFQASTSIATGFLTNSVAIADFNADGLLDLAVESRFPSDHISIFFGNGNGTFTAGRNFQVGPQNQALGFGAPVVVVGDFNEDGKLDLAVTTATQTTAPTNIRSNLVVILLGNGDGTFQSPVEYPTGGSPEWIAAIDLNGDGTLDLAISTGEAQSGPQAGLAVLLGNGDGTFQPYVSYSPLSLSNGDVIATDFNGDGELDLATLVPLSAGGCCTISVFLGNGDGTFQPRQDVPLDFSPVFFSPSCPPSVWFMAPGDFNGDGRPDLAVTNVCVSQIAILLNLATVVPLQTTTALTASASTVTVGSSLTLTATVTSSPGSTTPTGTVTFYNGSTPLGTGTVTNGVATYSTQSLAVGTYSITATYSGDANHASSTSPAISVAVVPPSGGQTPSGGGGGGCTINPSADFDPIVLALIGILFVYLVWRRTRSFLY